MTITLNKKAIIHYAMIYLLYMLNDSYLYKVYLSNYNAILVIVALCIIALHRQMKSKYVLVFSGILLMVICFVRILVGGVGIDAWFRYLTPILWTMCVVEYNRDKVLERWVNLVTTMAVISLICYAICQVSPDTLRSLFPSHYRAGASIIGWRSETSAIYQNEYADGLLLYSIRFLELYRNNGVFSEPGLYQMVLASAIFICLFMNEGTENVNRTKKILIILILTMLTTMSTSGYLSLFVMLLIYIVITKRSNDSKNVARFMGMAMCILGSILLIEYGLNGNSSVLHTMVFKKLYANGSISLSADSGVWRLMTIETCWKSMLQNPLGVGFDRVASMLAQGSTGAQIFVFGAALGIIPFFANQIWQLYPLLTARRITVLEKIAYVFIFYNCMLSQSKEFYSALLLILLYLYGCDKKEDRVFKGLRVYE